uniref:PSP proline-rich domain-containing protein n=1 Tax=Meloidogyne incognita TaxID=6306 RepID=A0A914KIJ9_MELIC
MQKRDVGRFHEHTQTDALTAGKISRRLREALGISERDLPEWIYRMRGLGFVHGYPPAYRKCATELSVFKMHFGENADRKRKHDEIKEDVNLRIDPEKIIKYVGFNYDDGHFRDKRKERYRIPPWSEFVNVQEVYLLQMDVVDKMEKEIESPSNPKKSKLDYSDKGKDSDSEDDSDILIVDTRPNSNGLEDGEIPSERIVDLETNVVVRRRKEEIATTIMHIPSEENKNLTNEDRKDKEKVIEQDKQKINDEQKIIDEMRIPAEKLIFNDKINYDVRKPSLDSFAQIFNHLDIKLLERVLDL